jgi:adenosine deaminase
MRLRPYFTALLVISAACSSGDGNPGATSPGTQPPEAPPGPPPGATPPGPPRCTGTPDECAATWEKAASDKYDAAVKNPAELPAFLKGVPKGGDLHNHLTGAVSAETYLAWAKADGDCINQSTYSAVYSNQCSATNQPTPTSGTFFDAIIKSWSMQGFVPGGAESGHDHFFATFGKFGAIAGAHRDDDLADIAKRAADENQLYIETMFNLGKNVQAVAETASTGTVTAADIPALYDSVVNAAGFATAVDADVKVVNDAAAGYKNALGCGGSAPPAACKVGVRFVAQVSRTGAADTIFGQLVSAFEMAAKTPSIVGANLSSPEDAIASLKNYDLHMAMLDFLHTKYSVAGTSPLHVTLHAGELAPKFLPAGYETANTFHVRAAVETGHAERIGHGIDVMSETDADALLDEMAAKNVLVEVCLSSNTQILEVAGTDHPLAKYLAHKVPVALATDDQGVSRSSLAGEYQRAALDQKLSYRQLKTMARDSLEHAFLPGASLWTSVADAKVVAGCASTATMGLGDPANASCKAILDASEKAALQWELERRFREFESHQ